MKKDHKQAIVEVLPKCDFCNNRAKYDCRTKLGPWAAVCLTHFGQYGIKLGLGWGQELILSGQDKTEGLSGVLG